MTVLQIIQFIIAAFASGLAICFVTQGLPDVLRIVRQGKIEGQSLRSNVFLFFQFVAWVLFALVCVPPSVWALAIALPNGIGAFYSFLISRELYLQLQAVAPYANASETTTQPSKQRRADPDQWMVTPISKGVQNNG